MTSTATTACSRSSSWASRRLPARSPPATRSPSAATSSTRRAWASRWRNTSGTSSARCGCDRWIFDEGAIGELLKLAGENNWLSRRDHPLIVNNVVCRALQKGFAIKAKTICREIMAQAMRQED